MSGGMGQVIHDKFIVVDFNSSNPVVFTGSSNLSSGGEEANGDNLLAIYDDEIVTAFAVEAVRLFDHYNFRTALKKTDDKNATATTPKPICLKETSAEWLDGYQDPANRKYRDRKFFIK
ncbi:phospholipase D-like domain-containing protein [Pseudarcicella hirudinis]|uniref:phospholipase D-like domain-containing protein n=1 Tax=Pseudarcicella hirudinis TaxID=1079859 RepID=UPI0035ED9C47